MRPAGRNTITIQEYFFLAHVANRNYRNGTSTVEVTLKDGGKWVVAGESLISKLVIDNGTVQGAKGAKVLLKVDGKEVPINSGQTYKGNVVFSVGQRRQIMKWYLVCGLALVGLAVLGVGSEAEPPGPGNPGGPGAAAPQVRSSVSNWGKCSRRPWTAS